MTESDSIPQTEGGTILPVEEHPLSASAWSTVLERVSRQNDQLSITTLEVILHGVREIDRLTAEAAEKGGAAPLVSTFSRTMFSRLARSYNNPNLLKEVGLIYLRDLRLPDVALRHFERSLRLGGLEKDLRPLTEAAAVAVQREITQRSGEKPAHSGIITAQHAKPLATDVIRKTGKMLATARLIQPSTTRMPEQKVETQAELTSPLPSEAALCLAEAAELVKEHKFKRAFALLRHANGLTAPKQEMWQGWTNLGQHCFEFGDQAQVEDAFNQALAYAPQDMASHFNLALGYHLNQKYELALVSYLMANQLQPDHPKVWCNIGALYFQMEQIEQAEMALRKAVEADPDYARGWDNLAAALGAQDHLSEALVACEKAIALRPHYPEAYFKKGVIYFSRENLALAAEAFKEASVLPPLATYCDAFLAMIYARLEKTEEAEEALRRVVKADPRCDMLWMAWNDLGHAWDTVGNHERAAIAYGEATMIKPDEPEAWFNLGVSYHQSGDLQAARNSYQHAVDLKDSLAGGWHNLGIVCAELDETDAAMIAFRQEVRWAPNNIRAWYDLGVALDKLNRPDEAKVAYGRAESLSRPAETDPRLRPTGYLPKITDSGMIS